jgi:hypothetical protein
MPHLDLTCYQFDGTVLNHLSLDYIPINEARYTAMRIHDHWIKRNDHDWAKIKKT